MSIKQKMDFHNVVGFIRDQKPLIRTWLVSIFELNPWAVRQYSLLSPSSLQ